MKSNIQLKYSDYAAFSQFFGCVVNNLGLDIVFPIVLEGYEDLYPEMVNYAKSNMVKEETPDFLIYSGDLNVKLKKELKKQGFIATEGKDMVAMFDLGDSIPDANIPEGYSITTLEQDEDYEKYLLCMFKGFGHEESNEVFHYDEEREKEMKEAYTREYLNKDLKVSIVDKEGNYVAHCGMWYDCNSEIALIEPVCVVPECRRLGLGREVVYEGLRKVKLLGAKRTVVGSSQQFYYSLGMVPHKTGTLWKPVE